ncbi:MAG: AI-2E family transporter [Candidatus Buchananbacteria bacterium]|nr:AI-2E family transporter [Candidatus Buchananbacteria bacterium]
MEVNKNITINVSTGTILKIIGIILALLFLWLVRDVVLVIFIAIIFAALIEPMVNNLERKKLPRSLSVILLYVAIILFLTLVVRLLIPPIAEQVNNLTVQFPKIWQQATANFDSIKNYSDQQGFLGNVQQGLQTLQKSLAGAAGSAYGFIVTVFRNVVNFFLILVITFYLVVQRDSLGKSLKIASPIKYHNYLDDLAIRIQQKIGAWARGQLILGLIIGILSFIGLIFLLPQYALVLAIVAGITELIPYLGPVLGAIPAVFLGFTVSPGHGLAVLILYIIIQQLENNVVVPQVMRRQLGLNPIVIIIAMLIGTRLIGMVGLILAVPVVTALDVVFKDFFRKSEIAKIKNEADNFDNVSTSQSP